MLYVSSLSNEMPYFAFTLVSQLELTMFLGLIVVFIVTFADYMFSNEHMNYLITYSFDFRNEELLSYYISFLRFVLMLPTGEWKFMIILHEICFLGLYKFC